VNSDYLLTVAEIAATVAGFSGLVTVVARGLGNISMEKAVHRLRSMLLLSLIAAGMALFPHIPARFGASEAAIWQVSSAVFFAAWLAYFVFSFRNYQRVFPGALRALPIAWVHWGAHIAMGCALFLGSLGVWGRRTEAVYALALYLFLYLSAYMLVQIFLTLAGRGDSSPNPPEEVP